MGRAGRVAGIDADWRGCVGPVARWRAVPRRVEGQAFALGGMAGAILVGLAATIVNTLSGIA